MKIFRNRKMKAITALTVMAILTVAVVYAGYWIYSNVKEYKTTMSVILDSVKQLPNGNIQLIAHITGFASLENKEIQFGNVTTPEDPSDTNFSYIGSAFTNSTGYAVYEFTPVANAFYRFAARVWIG